MLTFTDSINHPLWVKNWWLIDVFRPQTKRKAFIHLCLYNVQIKPLHTSELDPWSRMKPPASVHSKMHPDCLRVTPTKKTQLPDQWSQFPVGLFLSSFFVILGALPPPCGQQCGTERSVHNKSALSKTTKLTSAEVLCVHPHQDENY